MGQPALLLIMKIIPTLAMLAVIGLSFWAGHISQEQQRQMAEVQRLHRLMYIAGDGPGCDH